MNKGKLSKTIEILQNILVLLAIAGRLVLSNFLGLWFPVNELLDDRLLVTYADLLLHISQPNSVSLVKFMGYPVLLNLIHMTGMTYPLFVSCLWILGAALFVRFLKELCDNRWFLVLSFLFLLYTPAAFDLRCGTRLYRNGVIAPLALITFSLAFLLLEGLRKPGLFSSWKMALLSLGLGAAFVATYYQKEDGIWLFACLLAIAAIELAVEILRLIRVKRGKEEGSSPVKRAIGHLFLAALPFLIFAAATLGYKAFNLKYFGVFETETRNGGEIGEFTSKLYDIESEDRTATLWVPFDAIEKAFAASETLSDYPELLESLVNGDSFSENVTEKGINGDFITWSLRSNLLSLGIWTNEADMQALFAQVNRELDAAFADGRLKKDGRIRISRSGGGRTLEEIAGMIPEMVEMTRTIVMLDAYEPGGSPYLYSVGDSAAEIATTLTGVNLVDHDDSTLNLREAGWMNQIVGYIFPVYHIANPVLLLFALAGFILALILYIRTRKKPVPGWNRPENGCFLLVFFLLAGFFAAYILAISWFCEFIWIGSNFDNKILKFYSIGGVPLFAMMVLTGAGLFLNAVRSIFRAWREKKR